MVLLPAPAGPSMAIISLRGEESVIRRSCDSTWVDGGTLGWGERRGLSHTLGPRLGHIGYLGRRHLQHRSASRSQKTQFPRRQESIDCFLDARARNQRPEKYFDFLRLSGYD